ncbi:MAG: hypothetical protein AABZ63_03245, partial [Actinomycetota bacterium]
MLAKQMPGVALTSLSHHIDIDWMKEAYRRTRKDGATGVDGQTAKDYEANLVENLRQLLDRAKAGTYRAPPVKRVHIPKGDGKATRPIGIPTFEDKVLQRAAAMTLGAVYEQDFLNCSYGFRPGRSAHEALEPAALARSSPGLLSKSSPPQEQLGRWWTVRFECRSMTTVSPSCLWVLWAAALFAAVQEAVGVPMWPST